MLTFTNQSLFGISFGSLQLQDTQKFTRGFVFGTMKSRYWASQTPNLSWEVPFLWQFLVPMSDFYTVIFKT